MSSLLDILHRRDGRAEAVEAPEAPVEAEMNTVELHLAVDNGPATPAIELATEPTVTAAAPPRPAAAEPVGQPPPADDATRVLLARQLSRRSRRSTLLLGAGLAVIVAGAGLATWLLDATRETGGESLFTAPPPAAGVVERPAPPPAAATPPAGPGTTPVVATPARATPAAPAREPATRTVEDEAVEDTAWFDAPATEPDAGIRITRGTTTNPLFPRLQAAWAAFQAADFARAETLYREVRAADPTNLDAMLGLAALAVRGNRTDEARDLYQSVLRAEPRNATAISALSTLPAAGAAAAADESTLKALLREQPGAAHLHFALGLQYVGTGRWPDAQSAFFEAVRHDPANADYAYNLAVSLDQLGKGSLAAAWYRRALELAGASSLFDRQAASDRLAVLEPAAS